MIKKLLFIGSATAVAAASFVSLAAVANATTVADPGVTASPIAVTAPACPPFTRSLYIGVTGSDVTALQSYLNAQGYLAVSPTGYFGTLTHSAVARWQANGRVAALGSGGSGIFGPLSRVYFARTCSGSGGGTTSTIQQLNSPGGVTLATNGIAEVRNASFYFTLANITATNATINLTRVGCWNAFPSDPTPKVICMIAIFPTPPQTLSVGQSYAFGNYTITLMSITSSTATFSVQ